MTPTRSSSSLLLSSLELSFTKVSEPQIRARLGTAAHPKPQNQNQARGRAGTITHASPEKAAAKAYDSKDDMWAVGCMLAELITGKPLNP